MGKKYDEKGGQVSKSYKVYPIKDPKDIKAIVRYLRGSKKKSDKMWLCLFVVGINVGLRCSDLVNLKVGLVYDIKKKKAKSEVRVVEIKTGKDRAFTLNKAAKKVIEEYMEYRGTLGDLQEDDWLFITQKGCSPTVKSVNRFMREVGKELNIPQRLGSHSLRKTWSFSIYSKHISTDPGIIYTLQEMLNHSSERVTLAYIDITADKIKNIYEDLNLGLD